MDPNLFHVDWEQDGEVLIVIVVLSFFVERALALVFEHRLYVNRFSETGFKEPIAFLVALFICRNWDFDALSTVILAEANAAGWTHGHSCNYRWRQQGIGQAVSWPNEREEFVPSEGSTTTGPANDHTPTRGPGTGNGHTPTRGPGSNGHTPHQGNGDREMVRQSDGTKGVARRARLVSASDRS